MLISNTYSSLYSTATQSGGAKGLLDSATSSLALTSNSGDGVSTYDFTSMTTSQLRSTVNDLVKSGKMSLKDSSPLVTLAGFGNGDPNQPIDVFSALKQGIAFKQQNQANDPNSGIANWQNALATLEGLQGSPSGVDTYA